MTQYIQEYYKRIKDLQQAGGSHKETSIRKAFLELADKYAKEKDLIVVDEVNQDKGNTPDAGLQSSMGLNYGYIENKDSDDDIEKQIEFKVKKGYKTENTIFENSKWFVLYQGKQRVAKIEMTGEQDLEKFIKQWVHYETPEIAEFNTALQKFKENVPAISTALHALIKDQTNNIEFNKKVQIFLDDCKQAIKNQELSNDDIADMIVQHILTKDIFNSIFDDAILLKHNTIAKSIEEITATFFDRKRENELMQSIKGYYTTIINKAKSVENTNKQNFLKQFYGEFYKAYNPQKADKQGIEYTPIEVVRFMVKMTDLLLSQHFDKSLQDKGVEVLDPCTGTGIFITEILQQIKHSKNFEHKFANEIYCNEIDIMPYYIANLNIEYAAKQIVGNYLEFVNLCLVDTLNNVYSLKDWDKTAKNQVDLFSDGNKKAFNENNDKIARQNQGKLKVIIGNPPYNANQQNENDNNKNYSYPQIDKRIKETYFLKSTAQKKELDLFLRFVRWASDRMESGVVAFITNNSYLNKKAFDGFRAQIRTEFDYAYFVDLKGDSNASGEFVKKQGKNIFPIQVGVGIMFLIKNGDNQGRCNIKYTSVDDYATREQKLSFLSQMYVAIPDLSLRTYNNLVGTFDKITPNDKNQWLGLVENDWQSLIPLISKECKNSKTDIRHPHLASPVEGEEQREASTSPLTGEVGGTTGEGASVNKAIFKLYSLGVATNRDKWVYDVSKTNLEKKVKKFIQIYDQELQTKQAEIERLNNRDKAKVKDTQEKTNGVDLEHRSFEYSLTQKIKWSRDLKKDFIRKIELKFDKNNIKHSLYRPFVKKYIYYGHGLNDSPGHFSKIFPSDVVKNVTLLISTDYVIDDGLICGITNQMHDLNVLTAAVGGCEGIPLHTFADGVTKMPNLTDFGRQIFVDHIKNISHPHLASPVEGEGKKEASTSPLTGEVAPKERVRVSEKFIQRSRELRKNQTEAEAKFWSVCRNNNLGFKFRRQQTIDNTYIADFVCLDKKLIIELDGGQHCESKYDEKRDKYLMQNDFKVVRFWNDEILNNIDGCIEVVLGELSHPHLASPVEGEGKKEASTSPLTTDVSADNTSLTSPLTGEIGELGSSGEGDLDSLIFYYCYAILNSTRYKQKYKENLKVDLPRIPLLANFFELAELGKKLADLHINYETAPKHNLELFEIPQKIHANNKDLVATDFKPNISLKVDKAKGEVKLDEKHILRGIPAAAFEYKIGNKSPIEWVCSDNCFAPLKYDKTENEQFLAQIDDYNWGEVKSKLIDLIPRLVTVSLETAKIIAEIDLCK